MPQKACALCGRVFRTNAWCEALLVQGGASLTTLGPERQPVEEHDKGHESERRSSTPLADTD
jgi:hypothetical protein